MDINQSSLDLLFRTVKTNYQSAFDQTPVISQQIATTMPMTTRQESYATLSRLPRLRKWLGARIVNSAYTQNRVVTADVYEDTVGLDKFDLEDDQYGVFNLAIAGLAQVTAKWPDDLVFDYIMNHATVDLGYDGVACYSTAHPTIGAGIAGVPLPSGTPTTQSNLFLNTALTYDNYGLVRSKMQSLVGPDGHPLKSEPTVLLVAPALEQTAKQIINSDFLPSTAGTAPQSNIWKNSVQVIVAKELATFPNNWWLLDTSGAVKPYVFHQLTAPRITALTSPTDSNVFMKREFLWGVEARGAATESVWFLSAAATSEATYLP